MLFISPGQEDHKKGSRIPLINIPLDLEDGESMNLEDFQWWSYSSDFKDWLKKNPREWKAESIEYTDTDFIRLNENKNVKSFDSFETPQKEESQIFEEESEGSLDSDEVKERIKFNYAYNSLLADGIIEDTFRASSMDSTKKALFMGLVGEEDSNDSMEGTLSAYRTIGIKTGSDTFNILSVDYISPNVGEIDDSLSGIVNKIIEDATKTAAAIGVTAGIFLVGKYVGGALGARWLFAKTVSKFISKTPKASSAASALKARAKLKAVKGIKTTLSTIKDIATLKNTRTGISSSIRASRIKNVKPVGLLRAFLRGTKAGNLFPKFMGASTKLASKAGAKLGSRAIPFVGEVLMLFDAGYSLWSWNRSSQAPKYGEVEDFAKGEFSPEDIEVGVPITVCWSQPSGSLLGWVATDETRTTLEMVKVATNASKVLFIITQANSKGMQEYMGGDKILIAAYDRGTKVERGFFDNDDLDFEIYPIEDVSKMVGPFVFEGICDWEEFEREMEGSPDYLIGIDSDAPEEYAFNFEDSKGDRINVMGDLVSTDDIRGLSEDDLEKIFGYSNNVQSDETSASEGDQKTIEGPKNPNESVYSKFYDFINEAEKEEDQIAEISPDDQRSPLGVAMYRTSASSYSNSSIAGSRIIPKIDYFIVDKESLETPEGQPVLVVSSSDVEFSDSLRGLDVYTEPKKEEPQEEPQDKGETKGSVDAEEDKDTGMDPTTPRDVKYKERRNSYVVKDRIVDGGINTMSEFLDSDDKKTLQIESWKNITKAVARRKNNQITEVTFRNSRAASGDKEREYKKTDGKAFEIAIRFIEDVKNKVEYK